MNINLNVPDISTRPAEKCVTKLKAEGVNLYYGSFQCFAEYHAGYPVVLYHRYHRAVRLR